ncbi:hypothetical protein CU097_001848, partial [Rhizopus azygosporus]
MLRLNSIHGVDCVWHGVWWVVVSVFHSKILFNHILASLLFNWRRCEKRLLEVHNQSLRLHHIKVANPQENSATNPPWSSNNQQPWRSYPQPIAHSQQYAAYYQQYATPNGYYPHYYQHSNTPPPPGTTTEAPPGVGANNYGYYGYYYPPTSNATTAPPGMQQQHPSAYYSQYNQYQYNQPPGTYSYSQPPRPPPPTTNSETNVNTATSSALTPGRPFQKIPPWSKQPVGAVAATTNLQTSVQQQAITKPEL